MEEGFMRDLKTSQLSLVREIVLVVVLKVIKENVNNK